MKQETRNRFFANADVVALDADGKQIIFGEDYTDTDDRGDIHNVCGLDLRACNGWVFTWNASKDAYDCIQAKKLTKVPRCATCGDNMDSKVHEFGREPRHDYVPVGT